MWLVNSMFWPVCVVNRDPRVLIHGRDILTVSLPDTPYGGNKAE